MSTSCGNPTTEQDALMLRRQKFDKSKDCVRCKENAGNIVIRHAVYCKACFFPLISIKLRRSLDPFVNPLPDGPRRKGLKASGNLLLGLSGGLGSTVLLDLVNQTYFSWHDPPIEDATGKPRGGKDHPRNANVWPKATVCYVETCTAFPGAKNRTEEVKAAVAKYERLVFVPLKVEDAFDSAWWDSIGGKPSSKQLGMDITNEDLILSSISSQDESDAPILRLQHYISSLPTQTAIPAAVQTLTRLLLLHTAMSTGSSHLLLGTSLTSLSISLISSISQGGGFVVREEAQEEWTPRLPVASRKDNGHKNGTIRIVRPLRDIGMKECAMWAWWRRLDVVGREKFTGGKQSIGPLTKEFIVGLERDYPSTVSTIARTCAKLAPKKGTGGVCLLCERPAQYGLQDWKSRISIRSFKDESSFGLYRPPHFPERDPANAPEPTSSSPSLAPFLCYSCHTTLTSRSSRGTTAVTASRDNPVPLPMWVTSNLTSASRTPVRSEDTDGSLDEPQELWSSHKMDAAQMKAAVADFLLDD
ncbi:hypothetical protein DXG03_001755 [Asterophora parasitica]|uniref:Cytoplasmic tRNA 2-thiolation protein 2 n=1 Tax=Asterophora parasitica TaxID=117018 RepID=A0A9P7G9L1_9AGAR|nr:hypothetical protein DXG03_001755 [Asterophora parasitica]